MTRLVPSSLLLVACLAALSSAVPASAQISAGNPTTLPWPAGLPGSTNTRGTGAAHDPVSGNFLVVGANGGWGVSGVIVNSDGVPLGAGFQISTQPGHVNYVRTAYGAHVAGSGGFLVAWVSEDGTQIHVHTRMVSTGGGLLGQERVISDTGSQAFLEGGPAIAYSPTSQRFLVVWQGLGGPIGKGYRGLKARLVGVDGAVLEAGAFDSAVCGEPEKWCRDPGIAWNPNLNEFAVSFSSENQSSGICGSGLVLTSASTLAGFRVKAFNSVSCAVLPAMTDIAFSPLTDRYVMTWYELIGGGDPCPGCRSRFAVFAEDGTLLQEDILSMSLGSYDSLAMAFNPVSQTILVTGALKVTDEISGVELNGSGAKTSAEKSFAGGERGWLARVASSQTAARWLPTYQDVTGPNNNISDPSMIPVVTTSTNGGSGGPPPPTDSDGDGVPDSSDACPNQYGTQANGCPSGPPPPPPPPADTDGDGKADNVDGCPTQYALTINGCPDPDGDGVPNGNDQCPSVYGATANGCPPTVAPSGDYNLDGLSELVFTNTQTGQAIGWRMNGISLVSSHWLWDDASTPGWKVVGTGDLTGDGKSDLLWQNENTGDVRLFKMDYFNRVGVQTNGLNVANKDWRIRATGDFNNDGRLDIVWQNRTSSHVVIWFMQSAGDQAQMFATYFTTLPGAPTTPVAPGLGWEVVGSADFDADGYRDLAWQHTDGRLAVWRLQGATILESLDLGSVSAAWRVRAVAHYGWDPREDVIFQHATTGQMYIWLRSGTGFTPFAFLVPNAVNPIWQITGPR